MLMLLKLNVLPEHPLLSVGVVIDTEELTGRSRETASTTFRFGSSKITFSFALPPFSIKPSPDVGMAVFVQLQVVQFKSTEIALSELPQFFASVFLPDKTKY